MVFPCSLHSAVGTDLQVESGPAVELPSPQNPLQMAEVCQAPGKPFRRYEVLLLLTVAPHHQSHRVVVHSPHWRENEMRANVRGAKAVQKSVGEAPNLRRCPHYNSIPFTLQILVAVQMMSRRFGADR